jgi:hypothetical protein
MKSFIILMSFIVLAIFACSFDSDKRENIHTVTGVVIDVGTCGGGEGFFGGTYMCKVSVKVNSRVEYWTVYGLMIKGQTVSRECYDKKGKTWCTVGK